MSGCICTQVSPSSVAVPTPLAAGQASIAAPATSDTSLKPRSSKLARGLRRYTPGAGLFLKSAMKAHHEEPSVRKGVNFSSPSGNLVLQSFGPNAELTTVDNTPVRTSFRRNLATSPERATAAPAAGTSTGNGGTATTGGGGGGAGAGALSRCSTGVMSRTTTGITWANSVGTVSGASALSRHYHPSEYGDEELGDEDGATGDEDGATGDVDALDWAEGPEYDTWSDGDDGGATSRPVTGGGTSRATSRATSMARDGAGTRSGRRKRLKGHAGSWSVKVLSALRLMPDRRGRLRLPSMVVFTRPRPPLAHRTDDSTWWTKIKGWAIAATAAHRLNTTVADRAAGPLSPTPDGDADASVAGGAAASTAGGSGFTSPARTHTSNFGDDTAHGGSRPPAATCCSADTDAASVGAASSAAASTGFRVAAARALNTSVQALGLGLGGGAFAAKSVRHDLADVSHHTVSTVAADSSVRGGLQSSGPSIIACDDGSVHRGAVLLYDGSQHQRQVAMAYARTARGSMTVGGGGSTAQLAALAAAVAGKGDGSVRGGSYGRMGGGAFSAGGMSSGGGSTGGGLYASSGGGLYASIGGGSGGGRTLGGGSGGGSASVDGGTERSSNRSALLRHASGSMSIEASGAAGADANGNTRASGSGRIGAGGRTSNNGGAAGGRDFVRVTDVLSSPFATSSAKGWGRNSVVLPVISHPDECAHGGGGGGGFGSGPSTPLAPPPPPRTLARAATDNAALLAGDWRLGEPRDAGEGTGRSGGGRPGSRGGFHSQGNAMLLPTQPTQPTQAHAQPHSARLLRTYTEDIRPTPGPERDALSGLVESGGSRRPFSRGGSSGGAAGSGVTPVTPRLQRTPTQDLRGSPSFGDTLRVLPVTPVQPGRTASLGLSPGAGSGALPGCSVPGTPTAAAGFAPAASFPRRESSGRSANGSVAGGRVAGGRTSVTGGGGGGGGRISGTGGGGGGGRTSCNGGGGGVRTSCNGGGSGGGGASAVPVAEELERAHRLPPGFIRAGAE